MILQSIRVHYKSLLLAFSLLFTHKASAQMIYPHKFFGARAYGSGRDVWDIRQANDGRLYFGTSSTLARFDGERWEHTAIPGDNTIYSIGISDNDQHVFIGAGGRFGYFDESLTYHPISEQLSDSAADFGTIWNIVVNPDGVYFRATKYIFRFHNEQLEVIHGVGDSERPFDLISSVNGALFTHIRGVGLAKIVGSQLVLLEGLGFDLKTNAYLPQPKGILIASRYDGLFLYNGEHIQPFGTLAIVGAGTTTISASQEGNTDYNPASGVQQDLNVQKMEATVTITDLSQVTDGLSKEVTVTTSPEGLSVSVTYNGEQTAPNVAGSYEVEAIINEANYHGLAKETLLLSDPTITGIKDESYVSAFHIYPNPVRSFITIEVDHESGANMIRLYDLSGHLKKEEVFNGTKHLLNLQQQPNGIFLLIVSDKSGALLLRRKVKKE